MQTLFEATSLSCALQKGFFFSFLSLFSFPARQNKVRTQDLRPIVRDPKSCRERTDLPVWPSAHTEQRQNWTHTEGQRKEKEEGGPTTREDGGMYIRVKSHSGL